MFFESLHIHESTVNKFNPKKLCLLKVKNRINMDILAHPIEKKQNSLNVFQPKL